MNSQYSPVKYPVQVGYTHAAPLVPVAYPTHWSTNVEPAEAAVDYLGLARRYWRYIAIVVVLSAACGYVVAALQLPVYRARTTLEVNSPNDNFMNLKQVDPLGSSGDSFESYIETQTKLLKSETLIGRVVDRLRLTDHPALFKESPVTKLFRKHPASPVHDRDDVIAAVAGGVTVTPDGRSRLLTLAVECPEAVLSADIANAIAEEFVEASLETRWNTTARTEAWLTQQLEKFRLQLRRSEEELQSYARDAGLLFTADRGSVDETKLKQVQEEFSRARAIRMEKQSQLEQAQNSPIDSLPQILDDASLRSYRERLVDLQRQSADLKTTYNGAHPKVVRLDKQISEVTDAMERERSNVVQRIRNEYEASMRREHLLTTDYMRQMQIVSQQAAKAIQYTVLKSDVETNRELYGTMLQKMKEAGIASAMRASSIRVVDRAKPLSRPYRPSFLRNMTLASVTGLCLCFVGVLVRERTQRRIRTAGQVATHFGIAELGIIPAAAIDPGLKKLRQRRIPTVIPAADEAICEPAVEVACYVSRNSLMAESFRSVAASLLLGGHQRAKVIVVTSADQKEGKTVIAANLAITLAATGQRVLIIDGDLRRPRLSRVFSVESQFRLSELLGDTQPALEYRIADIAQPTGIPNLSILTSQTGDADAKDLLYSQTTRRLILRARVEFDCVLIDAPPLFLADARILSKLADGVLLVCRLGSTSMDRLAGASKSLTDDGTPIIGAVLNSWRPSSEGEDYYGAYRGYSQVDYS